MALRKKRWEPIADGRLVVETCPKWQHAVKTVRVIGDVFALRHAEIDYLFAVFASNGYTRFVIDDGRGRERWLASVARRSVGAAERYEQKMRSHFRRYKKQFTEGYSLPSPPTPELRVIYDSASRRERRPPNPCGTTLWSGFSGGEFHWREWPLSNVVIREA